MLIPKKSIDCVCFVCTERDGEYVPVGTGFFLGVPIGDPKSPTWVAVVVTALHVLNGIEGTGQTPNKIYLRVNTKYGGVEHVYIPPGNWVRPDIDDLLENGMVDAAVCWFPGNNSPSSKYDYLLMPASNEIAFRQFLDDEDIGIGDDVFFTGLFKYHTETSRNEPIVRSGIIAAMAETIATRSGPQHAFLVESRSMGGFSGSPVFVTPGLFRFDEEGKIKIRPTFGQSFLTGVISGHWDAPEDVQIMGGLAERTSLNMGVAKVTPMEKVFPLIEQCVAKFQSVMVDVVKKTLIDIGAALGAAFVDFLQTAAAQQATDAAQQAAAAAAQSEAPTDPS